MIKNVKQASLRFAFLGGSFLVGCGPDYGPESDFEQCPKDVDTGVIVALSDVNYLADHPVEFIRDSQAKDAPASDVNVYDVVDRPGEIACLNEFGELVLTPSGIALQAVNNLRK